jgi:hypothetical protein
MQALDIGDGDNLLSALGAARLNDAIEKNIVQSALRVAIGFTLDDCHGMTAFPALIHVTYLPVP